MNQAIKTLGVVTEDTFEGKNLDPEVNAPNKGVREVLVGAKITT